MQLGLRSDKLFCFFFKKSKLYTCIINVAFWELQIITHNKKYFTLWHSIQIQITEQKFHKTVLNFTCNAFWYFIFLKKSAVVIARTWKQPRCPSADEWIRKLWYIYTMDYYSAIKKNSSESVLMRWTKLELIIQSEVSQKDKEHYSILTHIYGI